MKSVYQKKIDDRVAKADEEISQILKQSRRGLLTPEEARDRLIQISFVMNTQIRKFVHEDKHLFLSSIKAEDDIYPSLEELNRS